MGKAIAVYDGHTRKRLAYLQNAYDIQYDIHTTFLWTGSFSLPYSDPKTKYCESFNLVELWDADGGGKDRYIGLFRILPQTEETLGTEANIVYELEHVISTLLDDVLMGYHEIGNLGVYTENVIAYILERQHDPRWVLKECDYSHQFLYGWENENLLSALYSIVQPFEETDYYWEFDTQNFPWSLSLKKTNKIVKTDIRYKKNLNGLTRIVDPTNLTTRLYCYGYGSGDNKLTIEEHNNGLPYLDADTIDKYGVITQVWTDERFTIAESLYDVGKAMLERLKQPTISYEMDIQTIYGLADLQIGDTVRIVAMGIDENMVVKSISKDDVTGAPQSGKILLGEGTVDISSSIAELADRQRIAETYSQGAESIFTDSFVDNADPTNPAEVTFTIPDNVVHVNEILFDCNLTNFRAYSKAVDGGGMGGQTTESERINLTTTKTATPTLSTTNSGGYYGGTSSNGGGSSGTGTSSTSNSSSSSGGGGSVSTATGDVSRKSDWDPGTHNHGIGSYMAGPNTQSQASNSGAHVHNFSVPTHTHSFTIPGHSHSINLPNHSHGITIDAHSHIIDTSKLNHSHDIDMPTHKHSYSLPNHVHNIEHGIYKGPSASTMDVYLDDVFVGTYNSGISNLNLISYMSKNANGDIMRGKHTIRIVPNSMTRVECTFLIRLFTNMHGSKQY